MPVSCWLSQPLIRRLQAGRRTEMVNLGATRHRDINGPTNA
jgi:hypothetical protein